MYMQLRYQLTTAPPVAPHPTTVVSHDEVGSMYATGTLYTCWRTHLGWKHS